MAFGMTNIIGELGIKITGYTSELSSSLKSATAEVQGFGRNAEAASKVSHAALMGIAAAATAVAAGLAISVKNAVEFEKGMTNIATIVDTNTESMEAMGNAVLDIAKRTPVQISDLTNALYEVRSAGISADDALGVLEKSAQLGMAGLGTTAETVDIVTSSINAFKLKGEELQNVYGYIFETTKVGKTTISDLAQGFGAVAGTVANANIELPEYLSAVAALTTTGLPAAQAHTQLKAAIAGVTRESEELTDVLNQLGAKSFKDLIDKKGGMVNAFKAITESVKGNDSAILKIFGSTEAYNAVIQLSGGLNGAYLETLKGMKNGTEDVTEAFEKQKNTVSAQWQTMKNNLEVLSIKVGSALLPALNQALQAVTAFIDKIPELINQFKDWVANNDWVQGALVGLGAVLTGLAISVIPSLVVSLGSLIATVAVAAAPFIAIAAIIAGIYVAFKNWDTIVEFVKGVWDKVVEFTMKAWEFLKPYIETALRIVIGVMTGGLSELVILTVQNWDKIKQAVSSFWEWIKPYLEIAVRAAFAVITFGLSEVLIYTVQNWDAIKAKTIETWEAVKGFSEKVWNGIVAFFEGIWNTIKKVFNAGLDAVNTAWNTTWNAIKDFTNNTWTAIKDLVTGGIEAVANLFYGGISIIGNAWRSIWDNVVNIVTSVFNTIQNTVSGIISWIQKALDKINIFKSEQASVGASGSWSVGGFTFGNKQQVAGVVHGGEWVAPAWMVDKYAGVISQLEGVRMRGYSQGGLVGANTTHNNQRTVHQTITQNIREGVDFSIAARELSWRARFV
ncbi:phage tail tape measure protein [Candidatus Peregrinibacteria bacterium]|nr:MAG: phage tail tape measure protein [Candidatus Peregrinibacteria bacterium]